MSPRQRHLLALVVGMLMVVLVTGCGSSEDTTRPLSVSVIRGFLRELPDMRYRFRASEERQGSGAVRGLAFGPGETEAEFEVSFRSEDGPEVELGPYLHSGVGFPYPGGDWGMTWKEIHFHRHRPQTGVTGVQPKICKWTTGSGCPI